MKFDVESIVDRLETSLRSKSEWKDVLFYGTNSRLIRIFAEALAEQARYDEYLTRESKWSLARNISSLLKGSQLLNYRPHRSIGAKGRVEVSAVETFDAAPNNSIEIPKYTVFSNGGDTMFTTTNTSTITGGLDTYVEVDVVQGEPKTYTTNALGDLNEVVAVTNAGIEDTVYEVFVNDILWTETSDLRLHDGTETVYKIENQPDFGGVEIRFGDNLNGRKLNTGDSVRFVYVETLGSKGDVGKQNVVNSVESVIYDIEGAIVEVFVRNMEPIIGGKDAEDIESIRTTAPLAFQSGERAVTRDDFQFLLERNGNILKASVWGAYDIARDEDKPGDYYGALGDDENYVYVAAISTNEENLSSSMQQSLRAYINQYKAPTDVMKFVDVEFLDLWFRSNVYVRDRTVPLADVRSDTIEVLRNRYSLSEVEFGENLYESDYVALIDGVRYVDYHDTEIAIVSYSHFNTGNYEMDLRLPLPPVRPGTVKVYVKHQSEEDSAYRLVAIDDGAGEYVMESGYSYDPVGSSINYNEGTGTLTINDGLPLADFDQASFEDFNVRVEHQVVASNLVLQSRRQIFRYYQADVAVAYS